MALLDSVLNTAINAVGTFWLDTANIEKPGSTAGTGSDTQGWVQAPGIAVNWPCVIERQGQESGAREVVDGGQSPDFTYKFTGPSFHGGATLIGVVKKGMRLRVAAKTTLSQPEQIYMIEDVGSDVGVILTIQASLPK